MEEKEREGEGEGRGKQGEERKQKEGQQQKVIIQDLEREKTGVMCIKWNTHICHMFNMRLIVRLTRVHFSLELTSSGDWVGSSSVM